MQIVVTYSDAAEQAEWTGCTNQMVLLIWDVWGFSNSDKCYAEVWLILIQRRVRKSQSDGNEERWSYLIPEKCLSNKCSNWPRIFCSECEQNVLASCSCKFVVCLWQPLICVDMSAFLSLFPASECERVSVCACGCVGWWWGRGVDGLSGSPGPGGTALVNNSDEAHYQGSADFSLIPP